MNDACFIVRDKNGQGLGYFYFEEEPGRRTAANMLTKDEARRLVVNFAKLPEPVRRSSGRDRKSCISERPRTVAANCTAYSDNSSACWYYQLTDQLEATEEALAKQQTALNGCDTPIHILKNFFANF